MKYSKQYLQELKDSEKEGLYIFKKFLPRKIKENSSKKHLKLFQLNRWKYIKNCRKILDIGCGKGNFIKSVPSYQEIWGMDIIKETVDKLNKQGFKAKWGDLNKKIPFKDNEFDGITCFHVLEHIADPLKILLEIKRVLKKDGTLLIVVPNLSFKKFYDDYTHIRPYTKTSLRRLLKDFGFKNIKIEEGPCRNQIVSGLFFIFPEIRFGVEKLLGKASPFEIIAIAKNSK